MLPAFTAPVSGYKWLRPPHHFAPPPALGGSRIGGCVPPALGYDFVVIPNRLARFGGSKTRLYWRLCPAGSWLSSRASPFSNVPRDARIGGCAPPALGYDFAETYIHMYMMAGCVCCASDADGPPCLYSKLWRGTRAAGSNSWTGQTHERGQQGRSQGAPTRRTEYRRQGKERPLGVDASKLIRLACSTWPVRILA